MVKLPKKAAFSFVEILFAIIALGVLIAPIFSMFSQGSSGTVRNRNDILAQQHASNLLAYAFALPYDHVMLETGPAREVGELNVPAGSEVLPLGMEEEMFRRTIEVSEVKPVDWRFSYKTVVVKVAWKQANEVLREIQIAGLVTR